MLVPEVAVPQDGKIHKMAKRLRLWLMISRSQDHNATQVQGTKLNQEVMITTTSFRRENKKNILMRIDELHKFSDGTLNDVRSALDDTLKKIRMKYLPQTIWRVVDRERAGAMIQAIDRQLRNIRLMRSLEKFVGGRLYGGDLRLLERTI
ncbi:hypothetical protein Tco_1003744 [Tanacetum coccineum]|uniref:Uncharacterized protein n=1 Tax=Tanacetum coccineum TaxID=301880 RepID=A0ABQ5F9Y3_9ASTR